MRAFHSFLTLSIVAGLATAHAARAAQPAFVWPPALGASYPDLQLPATGGTSRSLADLKGKVIVVEMIGMNCPACQSWAGARTKGAFQGVTPQENLEPISETFPRYSGVSLDDPRIVYVQMLLFNMQMKAPDARDVKLWNDHFNRGRAHPPIVITASPEMLQPRYYEATYGLVPGFQVIDKKGVLRYDATGDHPRENLWRDVLPHIRALLEE